MTNFDPSIYENELNSSGKLWRIVLIYLGLIMQALIGTLCCSESSGNAADHNLDLSLGNSGSKQNSVGFSNDRQNAGMDQQSAPMAFEADWRNRGIRPKVHIY